MHRKIKCPNCRKETVYSPENPFRPFCSERCQLLDLGAWADGKYAIPVSEDKPSSSETDNKGSRQHSEDIDSANNEES
jgi:endogenous inhibitor of DNA gyrase (YacG/DUF329 family)